MRLFPIRPATTTYTARLLPPPGASEFSGEKPPHGALITYYLSTDPPAPAKQAAATPATATAPPAPAPPEVKISVKDGAGQLVRELTGPDRKGLHRVAWDLRYPLSFKPTQDDSGWFGTPAGPFVLPGDYTVTIAARGKEVSEKVTVRADPRVAAQQGALETRLRLSRQLDDMLRAFTEASTALARMDEAVKRP